MKKITLVLEKPKTHKMDKEELQNHLHLIKTGHRKFKDKTKFNRKEKYKTNY